MITVLLPLSDFASYPRDLSSSYSCRPLLMTHGAAYGHHS